MKKSKKRSAPKRNFRILRLRGMWHSAKQLLSFPRIEAVQIAVDQELILIGAEPEAAREKARKI